MCVLEEYVTYMCVQEYITHVCARVCQIRVYKIMCTSLSMQNSSIS
jgi:hypothetical protein